MDPSNGLGPSSNKDADKSVVFEAIQNVGSLEADVNNTGAITSSEEMTPDAAFMARAAAKRRSRILRFVAIGVVIIIGLIVMLIRGLGHSNQDLANARTDASQRFNNTSIPLAKITGGGSLSVQNNQILSINGQLNVNNSLVLAPTKQPSGAVTGQLYYDQDTNQLTFFNGKQFVKVVSGDLPTPAPAVTVNGTAGALTTGSGIALAGNQLSNAGVLTLQGETGNVTLTAGNGILVNGTTLSNSGLLSLGGQSGDIAVNPNGLSVSGGTLKNTGVTSVGGQTGDLTVGAGLDASGGILKNSGIISAVGAGTITVTNDGNGNIIIDGPNSGGGGSGTVASPGGTTNKIAKFTGVQTIADSLLSDDGTTVTVGGALHVTGAVTLNTPLSVANGGTGANSASGARTNLGAAASGANSDITSLTGLTTALTVAQGGTGIGTLATNGVIIGNGTSPLSSVVAGSSGLCLVSTAGTPTWQTCPGSGGVASVDGLTGALGLANSSGSGATITINDASTSGKGIASFNATNFLVASGAVNTVQDISVSSTPTFAGLSLTSPLAVASGGTGKSSLTTNGVVIGNGSGAVTSATGSTGQCLVVSVGGSPTFQTCPGSGGVASVNSATGAVTIQGTAGSSVSTVGGAITINDASTSVKGLASFNSTNFTVSSGAVNTVQDIATTSAPQFGQLSIVSNQATGKMLTINNSNAAATGNLLDLQLNGISKLSVAPNGNLITSGTISSGAINGQTISNSASFTGSLAVAGALSVNTISPTAALTVGVGSQAFTLQGNASSIIKSTNGTNTTIVGFQSPTANVNYSFAAAAAGNYDVCTTAGNCVGVGGGVTTPGGTANTIAKFTASGTISNSIITDDGSTVTIGGTLSVNSITPTSPLTVGATSQNLTLQGAAVTLSATSSGVTNSLVFATPSAGNKTITLPNASGTVAVSASGPLSIDASGNLTCPTCLTSGGGGGSSGVSSLNSLTGALVLQGTDSQTFSSVGTTISVHDATSGIKGVASFNATNLTVTSGNVNTVQDIAVTSTPTFAGLNLTSALTVTDGGTGANSASGARTNLGAAASGANGDITSLTGLTTALSVVQGGTGIATTPTNGQILIGNGTGYSLNTLTAGSGVSITNTAGSITISAPGGGTCATCATTSLNNLASVAINTSLLPGVAGGADLGSATLPFGQLFLAGTSASPATNNFKITGAATASRTITLPDASGTVAVSASGYLSLSASGNLTFVGPLAVTDGGTGANSASGARTNLGAAASGANGDITSLSGLTTALTVAQGGTGMNTLTANQLLYATSSSTIGQLASGTTGQCLISNGTGAAPSFQTCTGAGGVASLDGLSGTLTINNTTGAGSTITITSSKADGSTLGIAAFNATNFTDNGSGVINTVQNINSSAAPTFGGLTLTGLLQGATAALSGSSSLSIGTAGTNTGSIKFYNGTASNTGSITLDTNNPSTTNYTIHLPAGNGTLCLDSVVNNCGYLTGASANGSYIQLQGSTPGTQQTGNFNVSGTGMAGILQGTSHVYSSDFDTSSSSALAIGANNATSITLGSTGTTSIALQAATTIKGTAASIPYTTPNGVTSYNTIFGITTANPGFQNSIMALGLLGGAFPADNADHALIVYDGRVSGYHQASIALASPDENNTIGLSWDGSNTTASLETEEQTGVNSSNLTLQSGIVTGGNGFATGTVTLASGDYNGFGGVSGDIIIQTGSGAANRSDSGSITIDTGAHGTNLGDVSGGVTIGGTNASSLTLGNTGLQVSIPGSALVGISNSSTGSITFANSGNAHLATIKSGATSADYTLTLPTSLGSSGQCLEDTTGTGVLGWTTCGGGTGANTSLSNLTSTSINQSLVAGTTNSKDLGSSSITWATGYFGTALQSPVLQTAITTGASAGITIHTGNSTTSGNTGGLTITTGNATNGNAGDIEIDTGSGGGSGTNGSIYIGSNATLIALESNTFLDPNKSLTFYSGSGGIEFQGGSGSYDQSASSGAFATGTGAVSLNGNTTIASGKTFTTQGDTLVKNTSTTAFQIQNASSTILFTADTSTSTITLGSVTSGNYITFTAAGGLTAFGTAQHTKTIDRTAEYAGAVLDAQNDSSCASANVGTMTAGYDYTNDMGYYNWASTASAQCYDVVVRITLPSDFSGFTSTTPLTLQTYTTNSTTGLINIDLRDTAHTAVGGCSFIAATPGSNNAWSNTGSSCNFSGGTFTAGGTLTLRIRMTANSTSTVRIGDLSLSYKSKF